MKILLLIAALLYTQTSIYAEEKQTSISDFQQIVETLRLRPQEETSNSLQQLFASFQAQFKDKSYRNLDNSDAKSFLERMALFVFVAESFNVKQADVVDLKTVREYIAAGFEIKKKHNDFTVSYYIDVLKAVFISYLLDDGQLRQSKILYNSIIEQRDEFEDHQYFVYQQLLAYIELNRIQGEVVARQYGNIEILYNRIKSKRMEYKQDSFIRRMELNSAIILFEFLVNSNPIQLTKIDDLPKKAKELYLYMTEDVASLPLTRLTAVKAFGTILPLLDKTAPAFLDTLHTMQLLSTDSIQCISVDLNCYLTVAQEGRIISSLIPQTKTQSYSKELKIYETILDRSRQLFKLDPGGTNQFASNYALVLYQFINLQTDSTDETSIDRSLKLYNDIKIIASEVESRDLTLIEFRIALLLARSMLKHEQYKTTLYAILDHTKSIEIRLENNPAVLAERLRLILAIVKTHKDTSDTEKLQLMTEHLNRYHSLLINDGDIGKQLAVGYYNVLLTSISQRDDSLWGDIITRLQNIRMQEYADSTIYSIESRARLAIINYLLTKKDGKDEIQQLVSGYSDLVNDSKTDSRRSIKKIEQLARAEISQRCGYCADAFKQKNASLLKKLQ